MVPLTPAQQRLVDWLANYLRRFQCSPVVREMIVGLDYTSPDPVQSLVAILVRKGVLVQVGQISRTIRFTEAWRHENGERYGLTVPNFRLPILGTISAHRLVEIFPDAPIEWLELPGRKPKGSDAWYVLQVRGDSMIGALIDHNDLIIIRPEPNARTLKAGTIVAARERTRTTLKYFYRQGDQVTLQPANAAYPPTIVPADEVEIQGVYVGLVRKLWEDSYR
ncbi:SOS-response repressor and protease LexA [Leptolyngbya sp. NIES-2104]|nr:SOS-response repressor and protease LexA [Leptolyngbya sp. NIES-2104]